MEDISLKVMPLAAGASHTSASLAMDPNPNTVSHGTLLCEDHKWLTLTLT